MQPSDIQNHEFQVAVRGYDRNEVRAYLTEIAQYLETQSVGDSSTQSVLAPATDGERVPSGHFAWVGEETQRILDAAAQSAEVVRERLIAQARTEATQKAQAEINSLTDQIAQLKRQIDSLRSQRADLAANLRRILEATEEQT
ncbi:DivIVA domain-containing protein [Stomatohabitans albus]|uniref:DivIVA domain-containing protein n=1 Tax=Stomatohabitans albus TaxID=3110766 RepID=UPI00300D7844